MPLSDRDLHQHIFSGYDEASHKYLGVSYHQVRALIKRPEQSIILEPEMEE
jgi:hypothetical protein